ncbi:DNA gyrase inhibitor YacG [Lutimaribacter marinistellae]|uniref:DNA gyrase inhibitor YacG n=1 Tax=Lutimaribacter marinistellae TaxID=1820329 RepID=A0ABV7TGM6_9RHOB
MNCPICGDETCRAFRPFCSKRCADIDLARWLKGSYSLPSEEVPDEGDLGLGDEQNPPRTH